MSTNLLYSIRVLIIHPTLTPDEISEQLALKPRMSTCVGEPRRGPKGTLLGGVWPDTRWSINEVRNGDRFFFARLDKLLDRFAEHRGFLRRIAETGGETNFIIEMPGEANIGDEFPARAVAKLADLKGSLGFEVYPGMRPETDVHIWPDDA